MTELSNPFDYEKFIGTVAKVTPQVTRIHFPSSKLLKKFYYDGDSLHGGLVRNFVVIEGEGVGFLAKVVNIALPEKERLELTEDSFKNTDLHPVGEVEIDLVFDVFDSFKAKKGVSQYPPVGAKVYVCSPTFLQYFLESFGQKDEDTDDLLKIGSLPHDSDYKFSISANAIFNRHCAIVGTTGGGKSWTVAKLVETLTEKESAKVLLLDATGEYENIGDSQKSFVNDLCFHYQGLAEDDLIALFKPGGQEQLPKLTSAVSNLKLLANSVDDLSSYEEEVNEIKYLNRKLKTKVRYIQAMKNFVPSDLHSYDITALPRQIMLECVEENKISWEPYSEDLTKYGKISARSLGNCESLIHRVNQFLSNPDIASLFNFNAGDTLGFNAVFDDFYNSNARILNICLNKIPQERAIPEILVNSIGRKLLSLAKSGRFLDKPLVVFIDEAHLFLNKKVKDEYSIEVELNAFERIAKECRKFGLFLCLATQRPKDIPEGVLSQMGTFIVHRLINRFDRESIEKAAPEGSSYALSFLPSLGEGEALLMGVNFPMPVNLKIESVSEEFEPKSNTPLLFKRLPVS